jgi:hypothetical protein
MTSVSTAAQDVARLGAKLLFYCRSNDWAGYDPYDALNSPILEKAPVLNSRVTRLILTQGLKRSPINLRSLLRVPKTQNPKGLGLFLAALLKAPQLGSEDAIPSLRARLVALRSPGVPYWCWGYSFPWQTRTLLVPRGAPNLVCSVFAANALLDLHERCTDQQSLEMAHSTARYIVDELYWADGNRAGLGYPLPSMRHQIHNANLLGAAFLGRVGRLTGDQEFLDRAMRMARYSVSCQRGDGSWAYGEESTQGWIDNFHTGFNLCALQQIDEDLQSSEFAASIRWGFDFYRNHFFRDDAAPRYFHDKTYPIDIHCIAQSIITLVTLRHLATENVALAHGVFGWAKDHMWDKRGFFYYRVLRGCKIRTPYMRWSQAWMLSAIAALLSETASHTTRALSSKLSAEGVSA